MNLGATDKLSGYYRESLYGKNAAAVKNGTAGFAEQLSAARTVEKAAGTSGVSETQTNGSKSVYYMGKSYEERLSKITDPTAANAFREAYAMKLAGGTDYISALSKAYSTGKAGAASFEDAFSRYEVITHVGNADIPSWKWQRNDFPFWKYFQPNTSADALNNWEPKGENPSQLRPDLQRHYGSIGAGKIAVLMPDSLKQKMDSDPLYAQQIIAKLQEWKEDYDRWNNTVAASYGYNAAEHQASLSYVFNLDENGDVRNCTVTGSGGTITGPTKEEQERFEAEQEAKRKRRREHTKLIEESSMKRAEAEREAIIKYYISRISDDEFSLADYGKGFMDAASKFNLIRIMLD